MIFDEQKLMRVFFSLLGWFVVGWEGFVVDLGGGGLGHWFVVDLRFRCVLDRLVVNLKI